MSYCVNCGVELDSSAKKCALCDTPVCNPNIREEAKVAIAPFSSETHIPEELSAAAKKKLIITVVSMVMFIPNLVCLLLNLTLFKTSFWSLSVFATSLFVWSAFVLPFCTKKPRPYILWAADSVMACVTALVQVWLVGGDRSLFTNCFLPLIAVASFIVLGYIIWYKKERHIILKTAFVFLGLAVTGLLWGIILSLSEILTIGVEIGIICFASCLALFGFFIYCYSSKTIRRWASKRFFV